MARRPNKEIRVSASDALEFEPEPATKRRVPTTVWLLLALVLITVAGLGGFLFGDRLANLGAEGPSQIPIVHAAQGPIKVRPQNPGGAEIPYRGYDINNRMKGEEASTRVETLLPAPETPLRPPEAAPTPVVEQSTTVTARPSSAPPVSSASESLLPAPPPPAPTPKAPTPTPTILPSAAPAPLQASTAPTRTVVKVAPPPPIPTAPAPAPAPVSIKPAASASQPSGGAPLKLVPKSQSAAQTIAPTTKPIQAAPPKPLTPVSPPVRVTGTRVPPSVKARTTTAPTSKAIKGWQIQLAASRSAKAARAAGEGMKKKHIDVLGKLRVGVVRADLGAKGVFYRIRLGPARDKNEARSLCSVLSKRGQGCLIVAPGK